ncbi:MAG: hypothetical protein MMC33_010907 [Icmadophila ericetorum]|nr:hypothetical protein [Icmadophila ericetorum]
MEGACAAVYQDILEVANNRIDTSELSITEKVEKWENESAGFDEEVEGNPTVQMKPHGIYPYYDYGSVHFVVVTSCLLIGTSGDCDNLEHYRQYGFFTRHTASMRHPENLGSIISRSIDVASLAKSAKLELFSSQRAGGPNQHREPQKVGKVIVWTAPCCSLIGTAFDFCRSSGLSQHLEYKVRVEGRFSPSCCLPQPFQLDRLRTLQLGNQELERLYADEDEDEDENVGDALDRLWVSQSIYRAEEKDKFPMIFGQS